VDKLRHSPLIYVLAQVRIGAILQMAEYVPRIQERLRKVGYPVYREGAIHEVRFVAETLDALRMQRWHFDNIAGNAGFLLQTGSVVFHTTGYETHEDFFAKLEQGLAIIHEVVGIAVVERIGLRYLDAVQADEEHDLGDYLQPGIRGLDLSAIGALQPQQFASVVTETQAGGTLVVRIRQQTAGEILPPDLQPPDLVLGKTFSTKAPAAILDYDHFIEQVTPFSLAEVMQTFGTLHTVVSGAFQNSVSPFALERWNQP
jgi:uncharacterized protein (TIGR04255 family)